MVLTLQLILVTGVCLTGILVQLLSVICQFLFLVLKNFVTALDNQTEIKFGILQGESPLARENLLLGEMVIKIPPLPAGEISIDARFSYDINGLLEVDLINQELNINANKSV